mmetsp:Transcript_23735/g.38825  ORF Transcript_23735/g.38825 Transcript_23735/m.38825 type:complete len:196 (-) Transcript_23735:18-605(-)
MPAELTWLTLPGSSQTEARTIYGGRLRRPLGNSISSPSLSRSSTSRGSMASTDSGFWPSRQKKERTTYTWRPATPQGGGPAPGSFWSGTLIGQRKGRYGFTPVCKPEEYGGADFANSCYATLLSSDRTRSRPICTFEKNGGPWPPPRHGYGTAAKAFAEKWPTPGPSQTMKRSLSDMNTTLGSSPYKAWAELAAM